MKIFFRTIFQKLTLAFFTIIVLPLLWLVEPFWRIRLGVLQENRMCHLAANADLMMRRHQTGSPLLPRTTFLYLAWNPANRQLLKMWKRHLNIVESLWLRRASIGFLNVLENTRFYAPLPWLETEHEEWSQGKPTLSFTNEEETMGRQHLAEMGIKEGDWFVCFQSRTPAYETSRRGFGKPSLPNWGNRDCHIENYFEAAKWIAGKGGFAVRMGATVDSPLPDLGPRIIDYSTHHRSDFMDVYLSAKCRFFLGNTSGLFGVPLIFNVPRALANYLPYACVGLGDKTIYLPKLLRRTQIGELVSFPEISKLGLMGNDIKRQRELLDGSTFYADHGLEWIENDAEDILGLAQDIMDLVEGREPLVEARRLQEEFRSLYSGPSGSKYAGRIGSRFVLRHHKLFEQIL